MKAELVNYSNDIVYRVGTIRQIHQQLVNNGFHISEHALRIWIKTGVLPAVYSGSKAFIAYDHVLRLLMQEDA